MALTLDFYAHGVSKGHKTWGSQSIPSTDIQYLGTFYGRFTDSELMLVEQREVGGEAYCYYTFLKNGLIGADNRGGSYFALTLRLNAYYADLQNLYGILRAAYEKMCVDTCVKVDGAVTRFCITDFATVDSQLRNAEKKIVEYISEFSVATDICPLPSNHSGGLPSKLNLAECTPQKAKAEMQARGCLIVSPLFPAAETARILAQKDQQISDVKAQAMAERQRLQKEKDEALSALNVQKQQELDNLRAQQAATIDDLRQKVATADARTRDKLEEERRRCKQQLDSQKEEVNGLKSKVKELEEENKKATKEIKALQNANTTLQQQLHASQGKGIGTRVVPEQPPHGFAAFQSVVKLFSPWFVWLNTLLAILLLVGQCVSNKKAKNLEKAKKIEVAEVKEQLQMINAKCDSISVLPGISHNNIKYDSSQMNE